MLRRSEPEEAQRSDAPRSAAEWWLVAMARGTHPFPSRTRPLSPVARMVLPVHRWESTSPPTSSLAPLLLEQGGFFLVAGWRTRLGRPSLGLRLRLTSLVGYRRIHRPPQSRLGRAGPAAPGTHPLGESVGSWVANEEGEPREVDTSFHHLERCSKGFIDPCRSSVPRQQRRPRVLGGGGDERIV
jgi:hypothetical protein